MHTIVLLLACAFCSGDGKHVHTSAGSIQVDPRSWKDEVFQLSDHTKRSSVRVQAQHASDALKAFALLLLASNQRAAFNPFSQKPHSTVGSPSLAGSQPVVLAAVTGSDAEARRTPCPIMASSGAAPLVSSADGSCQPQIALGLYNVPKEDVQRVVKDALALGYRHFDSASFYDNEAELGTALRAWMAEGHDRSELFVTTKVWTTDLGSPENALRSAKISIEELDIGYVDMVMVHWPVPGSHPAAYVALEALVKDGKSKGVGVSNYSPEDYEELMKVATVPPGVNTFEVNPLLYRKKWIDFFQDKGVVVQAYKPMQRGGPVLSQDVVTAIATRLEKTPAQICIRWGLQKGLVVITKSINAARIAENIGVFDFELSPEDVEALDALTTEDVVETARLHYETRKNGTPAPWGDGLRPEKRVLTA